MGQNLKENKTRQYGRTNNVTHKKKESANQKEERIDQGIENKKGSVKNKEEKKQIGLSKGVIKMHRISDKAAESKGGSRSEHDKRAPRKIKTQKKQPKTDRIGERCGRQKKKG